MILENILDEEPYENKNQFQETKIRFLQKESGQLTQDIAYYKDYLRLSKEALRLAYITSFPNNNFNLSANTTQLIGKTEFSRIASARENGHLPKNNQEILELMREEQIKLSKLLEIVQRDIKLAQHKTLLAEINMTPEVDLRSGETVGLLEDRLDEMMETMQEKEYRIQELEKIKNSDIPATTIVRYKETMFPTTRNLRYQKDYENSWVGLQRVVRNIGFMNKEQQELLQRNKLLVQEMKDLKRMLKSPRFEDKNSLEYLPQDNNITENCILEKMEEAALAQYREEEAKLAEEQQGAHNPMDISEDLDYTLPDKVKRPPRSLMSPSKGLAIPRLDLTAAKRIQEKTMRMALEASAPPVQPSKQQQQHPPTGTTAFQGGQATAGGATGLGSGEQVKRLEADLATDNYLLQIEMQKGEKLEEEIGRLQKENEKFLSYHDILVRSNKRLVSNEEMLQKIVSFYHRFANIVSDSLGHKCQRRREFYRTLKMQTRASILQEYETIAKMAKVNAEVELATTAPVPELCYPISECKQHLLVLKAQLQLLYNKKNQPIDYTEAYKVNNNYRTPPVSNKYPPQSDKIKTSNGKQGTNPSEPAQYNPAAVSGVSFGQSFRLRRSRSNPFDYIYTRKGDIYAVGEARKTALKERAALVQKRLRERLMAQAAASPGRNGPKNQGRKKVNANETLMISFIDWDEVKKGRMAGDVSFMSNNGDIF